MNRSQQARRPWNRNLPPLQTANLDINNYNGRSPSPQPNMQRRNTIRRTDNGPLNPQAVYHYLTTNPNFLEDYVMKEVDLETLERWIVEQISNGKMSMDNSEAVNTVATPQVNIQDNTKGNRWKIMLESEKQKLLETVLLTNQEKTNSIYILLEMAECIASAVNAVGYNLYLRNAQSKEIYWVKLDEGEDKQAIISQVVQSEKCLAAYVANSRKTLRTTKPEGDVRFPDGVAVNKDKAKVVMCQPVLQNSDNDVLGVLEFYRSEDQPEFSKGDEQIGHRYQVWCGITLYYIELCQALQTQRKQNSFLLNIIKSIFQEMVCMDSLIMKIMNFTQKLVKADRASLFLLDTKHKELYARIFDMKNEAITDNGDASSCYKEIRFPVGTGFAGIAAETGQIVSVPDAYQDSRFNKAVDERTGYRTRNVLCMPIFIRGSVIGVMQMVNKEDGEFNQQDIDSFQTFASYCGLALHHAKLYDKIQRSENRFKIAMEMVAYHSSCSENEVDTIKAIPHVEPLFPDIDSFSFASKSIKENEQIAQSVYMFQDLFGLQRFDLDCLIRFTLTVKNNYRRVPYHNWGHGFTVANSSYALLKATRNLFSLQEALALYIGCLCHDLDHRGKTNKFMSDSESPLAAIYTTSTLEHHHFNQTMAILQQDDLNVLRSLSSLEYKQVLNDIRHCILATDLAQFFGYKVQLQLLVNRNSFDWNNEEHRKIAKAVVMTACDLCASTKPWEQQLETAKIIFEEFYDQGDAERAGGRDPMPMMDRNKVEFQPSAQVGFLKGICIPCYSLMAAIIPETQPMLEGCKNNLQEWEALAEKNMLERQNSKDSISSSTRNK